MAPSAMSSEAAPLKDSTAIPFHPSPVSLAHVVLRTTPANYQPMIAFYQRLLNATLVHTTPFLSFLRYDYEHHRIAIIQTPDTVSKPKNASHAGLDHIAFTYGSLTELAQTYISLKEPKPTKGSTDPPAPLEPDWAVNHGPTTSLYYRDPDLNKVELQVDNFDTPEDADAFMKGDLFEMNPVGSDFDADKWARDIMNKADVDGGEGLREEERRKLKTRVEVGERRGLPEGF